MGQKVMRSLLLATALVVATPAVAASGSSETRTVKCSAIALLQPVGTPLSCTTNAIVFGEGDVDHTFAYTVKATARTAVGETSATVTLLRNGSPFGAIECGPDPFTCTASQTVIGGGIVPNDVGNGFALRCAATSTLPVLTSVSCRFEVTLTPI